MAKRKNPAAVALARLGAKKGGIARAARLTPEQRSESARKAVLARWAKAKKGSRYTAAKGTATPINSATALDISKKALHYCLKRLKNAKDENEIRRLALELQRIVFHKQYENAENQKAAASSHYGTSRETFS